MADITITTVPFCVRMVVSNDWFVVVELPQAYRQLDVVFEDSNGKAALGVVSPGVEGSETPPATVARAFAWSYAAHNGVSFNVISVACPGGANHAFSLIVT